MSNKTKGFEAAYDLLPAGIQISVRNQIMKACHWKTVRTFHQKKRGEVRVTELEIPHIRNQFAVYNISAFEGTYIKQII